MLRMRPLSYISSRARQLPPPLPSEHVRLLCGSHARWRVMGFCIPSSEITGHRLTSRAKSPSKVVTCLARWRLRGVPPRDRWQESRRGSGAGRGPDTMYSTPSASPGSNLRRIETRGDADGAVAWGTGQRMKGEVHTGAEPVPASPLIPGRGCLARLRSG